MSILSSYVSSRIHIYVLMFLLGAVSLDLVFDGPAIFGIATDEDYMMMFHYYSNTMPSLLATVIMPILVVIGTIGIFIQVYLDKSVLSYICLVMTLVGGAGYSHMVTAELELQQLDFITRSLDHTLIEPLYK